MLQSSKRIFTLKYTRLLELIKDVVQINPKRVNIEKECYTFARTFILTVLSSMKKRLLFEDNFLLMSQIIFLKDRTCQVKIWRELAISLPNIITNDLEVRFSEELDVFELNYKAIYQQHLNSDLSIIKRWDILSKNYPCISALAKALLVLPYSSAAVEKIFSTFKAFVTPVRNQLSVEALESSILIEQAGIKDQTKIMPQMIERYFKNTEKKPESLPPPKTNNEGGNRAQSTNLPNSEQPLNALNSLGSVNPANLQSINPHSEDGMDIEQTLEGNQVKKILFQSLLKPVLKQLVDSIDRNEITGFYHKYIT